MRHRVIQRKRSFGILSLLLLIFWSVNQVTAHAVQISSNPAPSELLEVAPERVEIEFSEPVVPEFSRILLLSQAGQRIATGGLEVGDSAGTQLHLPILDDLENGSYLVSWQVLSTVDGHTTSGSFPFGIGVSEVVGIAGNLTTDATKPTLFSAGGRWLNLAGLALLAGIFTFRLLVWNPAINVDDLSEEEQATDNKLGQINQKIGLLALGLGGIGLIFTLLSQAQRLHLFEAGNIDIWLNTQFGKMWLVRILLILALLGIFSQLNHVSRKTTGALWFAGILLLLMWAGATALVSHSAALNRDKLLATGIDLAHLLSAGIWVGGLLQLLITLWLVRRLNDEPRAWLNLTLLLNFSVLAAFSTGVLIISGSYLAWQHIGSWNALFGTDYGKTLLFKIGLALVTFLIAGINLFYIKPRIKKSYDQPATPTTKAIQQRFGRFVRFETVVALLILLVAGYLTDLQRGKEAPLQAGNAGTIDIENRVDDLNIALNMVPATVGPNDFTVTITDENGQPVTNAANVRLKFTFLGQALGSANTDLQNAGNGTYTDAGNSNLSLVGPWQLEITVRRDGLFDTFVPLRLDAGLDGKISDAESSISFINNLATNLTRFGGLVPGVTMLLFALFWGFLANRTADRAWQLIPLLLLALIPFWLGSQALLTFYEEYTPARFTNNPILPDLESVAQGKQLYEATCLTCHGEAGHGDGPTAASLSTQPVDFSAGHTETHPDGDLFYWIREGIEDTEMPAFGDQVTEEETWHLVNYIRRLNEN